MFPRGSVFTLWLLCVNKALFTDCLHTVSECLKISRPHFKCSFRTRPLAFYVIRECKAKEPKSIGQVKISSCYNY